MRKYAVAICLALIFAFSLNTISLMAVSLNLPAKISVEVPSVHPQEEIVCSVTVIRLAWQKVDASSFQLDDIPIKMTFVEEQSLTTQKDAEALMVSKYRFSLPGKAAGLYLLPAVSAIVGDVRVFSLQVSYEVVQPQQSQEFLLAARVIEKGPFYVGQRLTVEYRIAFRSPIQLTKENLPLFTLPGMRSIGAVKIDSLYEGENSVQVLSQKLEAVSPGTYHSGVSTLEGYVYAEDMFGRKIVQKPLLFAQAPDVEISVLDFPKDGQPLSFNGALGVFHWRVKRLGSGAVSTDEKIELEVLVSGSGEFDTVRMPDLSVQKGFQNTFRLSDLEPVGQMQEGTKRFVIAMRPNSPSVRQIPAIEFSSFDPLSKKYVVKYSEPIAITVKKALFTNEESGQIQNRPPGAIEIQGNVELQDSEMATKHMDTILAVYALIFLGAVLGVQYLFCSLIADSNRKKLQSRELFIEAIKKKTSPDVCARLLEEALLLKLFEKGQTERLIEHPQDLTPSSGLQEEVRAFLLKLQHERFSGLLSQQEIKELVEEASELYYRLK